MLTIAVARRRRMQNDSTGLRQRVAFYAVLIAGLFISRHVFCQETLQLAEPPNLGLFKQTIEYYVDSGAYQRDLAAKIAEAKTYLTSRTAKGTREVMVLDIDETALSNLPYERAFEFGYTSSTWDEWIRKAEAPAIAPTLELFKWARSQGTNVIFITGRKQLAENLEMDPTVINLKKVGYDGWQALYFRPAGTKLPAAQLKNNRRAEIAAQGYTIIACIGDQYSDLEGENIGRAFKLPNPFYYVP